MGLVRHAWSCWTFSKKCQYLWEGLGYFVFLLHVVTFIEATVLTFRCSCIWFCMPKVLWYNKLPISLEGADWFCWFFAFSYLHLVRYPLKLQKYAILGWYKSGIGLEISRTIWGFKLIFWFNWSYKNMLF